MVQVFQDITQFLTFTLEGGVFAVEISRVREVLEYTSVTSVPRTPEYMVGVINLRGAVVPVVDLRRKFSMGAGSKTVDTCIIIIEVALSEGRRVLGALVDSVKEVLDLHPDQIEPAPKIGSQVDVDFILGMGKHGDQFIILLNTDRVFSTEELSTIAHAAA